VADVLGGSSQVTLLSLSHKDLSLELGRKGLFWGVDEQAGAQQEPGCISTHLPPIAGPAEEWFPQMFRVMLRLLTNVQNGKKSWEESETVWVW